MIQKYEKKVLVVEDEEDLLNMYCDILDEGGIKTIKAKNGIEGLEMLKNSKVDLVLLDLMMPEMDGFTVLKEIRKNPQVYGSMPIIILTALISDEAIKETYETKADAYIGKDIPPEEFLAMVKKYLEKN